MLDGRTLVSLAIDHAFAVEGVSEVYVSTDSEEIAAEAEKAGASVPFLRPAHLAKDDSPEWAAWQHLVEFLSNNKVNAPEYLLAVPVTAPLRVIEDIEGCIRVALADKSLDGAICVTPSRRNPYFNMTRLNSDGSIDLAAPKLASDSPYRRQDAELLYEIVPAAYFMKTDYILTVNSMWAGRLGCHIVPEERAIDIDSEIDFQIAEFLYARALNGEI